MSDLDEIRAKVEAEKKKAQKEYAAETAEAGGEAVAEEPDPPAWATQVTKNKTILSVLAGCTIKQAMADDKDGSFKQLDIVTEGGTPLQLFFENDIEETEDGRAKYSRVVVWLNDPAEQPKLPKPPKDAQTSPPVKIN